MSEAPAPPPDDDEYAAVTPQADPQPQPELQPDAVTREAIEQRAYQLSRSPEAGTDEENWLRAERELRAASGTTGEAA